MGKATHGSISIAMFDNRTSSGPCWNWDWDRHMLHFVWPREYHMEYIDDKNQSDLQNAELLRITSLFLTFYVGFVWTMGNALLNGHWKMRKVYEKIWWIHHQIRGDWYHQVSDKPTFFILASTLQHFNIPSSWRGFFCFLCHLAKLCCIQKRNTPTNHNLSFLFTFWKLKIGTPVRMKLKQLQWETSSTIYFQLPCLTTGR